MKLTYKDLTKENWFLVSWTLSNKCNYRCAYCPSYSNDGSSGWPNKNHVFNFVKTFNLLGKQICYRLTGGEPTYWKYFIELAQIVHNEGHYFSFLTNGSRSVEYYKEISQWTDGIIISYHPQYANIEHIISIANNITCPVALNLMMVPEIFEKQVEIAKKLFNSTNSLAIWPKIILDKSDISHVTNKISNYTDEQKEIINTWPFFRKLNDNKLHRGEMLLDNNVITANDLIVKGLNKHKGWKCWAGLDMIKIDMYGDMYRAECEQGGKIGSLLNFNLPTSTITCSKSVCACLSDIYLRKET